MENDNFEFSEKWIPDPEKIGTATFDEDRRGTGQPYRPAGDANTIGGVSRSSTLNLPALEVRTDGHGDIADLEGALTKHLNNLSQTATALPHSELNHPASTDLNGKATEPLKKSGV